MIRKITIIYLLFILVMCELQAQHNTSEKYTRPVDSLVINNLKKWQGLKFGLSYYRNFSESYSSFIFTIFG